MAGATVSVGLMARTFSKKNRVLTLITLMFVSSLTVGGIVTVVTSADTAMVTATTEKLTAIRGYVGRLSGDVLVQEMALDDYVLSRDRQALLHYYSAVGLETVSIGLAQGVASNLPHVVAALTVFHATTQEWRDRVATPTIAAVEAGDTSAIARFSGQSAEDHAGLDTVRNGVDVELQRADEDLARTKSANATTIAVGIAIAFGFLIIAFAVALAVVRRFGGELEHDSRHSSVLNRFTEVTSFAIDDREVAAANLVALDRLVQPDASVTHILNRSMDRAVPEASTGNAIAEILPLRSLERCAGVLRGTMYVNDDLADELSVHCPIYPSAVGTLACVPLISGESVGAVHLYWRRPNALPLSRRTSVARITEHAALAIGNRRLLAALHGQANTDPRTGLANSRAFDLALEASLTKRAGHETLSVLMLDVDHFKKFNDAHGHPAGDEALRAFGGVLRSCMREGDIAARYGGEEFAVLLPGVDGTVATTVAERIRSRTESTIIALAPGITDHITVSIGISTAPEQGLDRVTLLRLADEALYRAKDGGRNRVMGASVAREAATPEVVLGAKGLALVAVPTARRGPAQTEPAARVGG